MPEKGVTHVSEHVLPMSPVYTVRRGWGGRDLAGLHQPRLSRETQPLDASTPPCLPLQRGGNWMAPTQKPEEPILLTRNLEHGTWNREAELGTLREERRGDL